MLLPAAVVKALLALALSSAQVSVDWEDCPITRSTAPSVLVAADPEWISSGVLVSIAPSLHSSCQLSNRVGLASEFSFFSFF